MVEIDDIVRHGKTYWRVTEIWTLYLLECICPRGSAFAGEHRQVRSKDGGKTFEKWRGFKNFREDPEWVGKPWRKDTVMVVGVKVATSKGKPVKDGNEYQLQGGVEFVSDSAFDAKLNEYRDQLAGETIPRSSWRGQLQTLKYSDSDIEEIVEELDRNVAKGYGVTKIKRGKVTLKSRMFTIDVSFA